MAGNTPYGQGGRRPEERPDPRIGQTRGGCRPGLWPHAWAAPALPVSGGGVVVVVVEWGNAEEARSGWGPRCTRQALQLVVKRAECHCQRPLPAATLTDKCDPGLPAAEAKQTA